jgi:hypothetical protein
MNSVDDTIARLPKRGTEHSSFVEEYEIRLKAFIDSKIHAISVIRAGDSYSWGYKEAMEDVSNYLNDLSTIRRIYAKPAHPIC